MLQFFQYILLLSSYDIKLLQINLLSAHRFDKPFHIIQYRFRYRNPLFRINKVGQTEHVVPMFSDIPAVNLFTLAFSFR